MRPDLVVIVGIALQDLPQVSLTQDDEVIETLSPDRSDQPFCKAILPRWGRRNRLVPDAHGTNAALGNLTVDAIVVSDQIAWLSLPQIRSAGSDGGVHRV
jgi:hypothetical protein